MQINGLLKCRIVDCGVFWVGSQQSTKKPFETWNFQRVRLNCYEFRDSSFLLPDKDTLYFLITKLFLFFYVRDINVLSILQLIDIYIVILYEKSRSLSNDRD